MSSFEEHFSPGALRETYDGYLRSKHDVYDDRPRIPVGVNDMTRRAFERQLDQHLAAMSRQARDGRFKFDPFREREIPKPGTSEKRVIATATIADAIFQKALYRYLYDTIDTRLGDGVHGYRYGLSPHTAVRAIRRAFAEGRVFVFDADIRKFFDSIDHAILRAMVESLPVDPRAKTYLWRFMRAGRQVMGETQPRTRTQGVPQGGVLSGMLANLYLAPMDQAIVDAGGVLVRYADDFVVCCHSPEECEKIRDVVVRELAALKLELHPEKTRVCVDGRQGVDFVGFRVSTEKVRVRDTNIHRFKARVSSTLNEIELERPRSFERALHLAALRIGRKIEGPGEPYIGRMLAKNMISHPHRRCWIGFFRIVTDLQQIRELDRWIQRQVSAFMWRTYRKKVTRRLMREFGLPTLLTQLSKARRSWPDHNRREATARVTLNELRIAGSSPRGNLRNPRRKVPTQGGGPDGDALDGGGQPLT